MDRQTVYIVDDDQAVLDSLNLLLGVEGYAVRTYNSPRTFLEAIEDGDRGCVIMDVRMPEMDGLEVIEVMKERRLSMRVIFITGHGDVALVVKAMRQGAIDLFQKPLDCDALINSIRATFMMMEDRNLDDDNARTNKARFAILSKREKEVLTGLLKGGSNKVIAYGLGISVRTVEVHRAALMMKMEAANLPALVEIALTVPEVGSKSPVKGTHGS